MHKHYLDSRTPEEKAKEPESVTTTTEDNPWSKHRKALKETVKKYPKLLEDIIDASYLAGLEATKAHTLKEV